MEVFVVKDGPKVVHVPQFIAYTELPLEFTNKINGGSTALMQQRIAPKVSHPTTPSQLPAASLSVHFTLTNVSFVYVYPIPSLLAIAKFL